MDTMLNTMPQFTILQSTKIQHQDMPSQLMELHWRKSLGFILLTTQLFLSQCISQTTIHQSQLIMLQNQLIMLQNQLIMLQSQLIMLQNQLTMLQNLLTIHQSQSTIYPSLDITQSLSMDMAA